MIAGLCDRYRFASSNGIQGQWLRFGASMSSISGRIGSATYGVILPVPGFADGFDYLAGVEVPGTENLPHELSHEQVPAGQYAVFEHRGHVSDIKAAWDTVWTRWLPQSGLEVVDTPILFEEYGADFDPQKAEGVVGLWVPVRQ